MNPKTTLTRLGSLAVAGIRERLIVGASTGLAVGRFYGLQAITGVPLA